MPDPFADRRGRVFVDDQMPDWTVDAACRAKVTVAGNPWEAAFKDDLSHIPTSDYIWPGGLLDVMETCAGCPVRKPCLQRAFDLEEPILLGWRAADDDWVEETLTPMPVGVYGGVPGPMRERFKPFTDKVARADAWFVAFTQVRGWFYPREGTAWIAS